jgi:outer membrane protein TolC
MKLPIVLIVFSLAALSVDAQAITLETVLNSTLEKNPAIQQAKAGLEQAVGQRLVFRSIVWPTANIQAPVGVQGGHRGRQNTTQPFGLVEGSITQPLFNAAIPASLRRGNVEVLIAQQKLNMAVVEQLHSARLAFYSGLYNRDLLALSEKQQQRLDKNVGSQKERYEAGLIDRGAFTSATLEARALDSQIETYRRAYSAAQLTLAEAMAMDTASTRKWPDPEGNLDFLPLKIDLESETAAALNRRADLQLARLMIRSAEEDQRIIEAGYFPKVYGSVRALYIPVSGIHREGSTSRTQDFLTSEVQERASYTWQVIDNGKVTGAAIRQRETREMNEIAYHKLEAAIRRELLQIRDDLSAIEAQRNSLAAAANAAQENTATVQQNLGGGLASELEYRLAEGDFFKTRSGLLADAYQYNVRLAEWDRATGRYFQFPTTGFERGNSSSH